MKKIIISIAIFLVMICIAYPAYFGLSYYQIKTGVVIDKYKFNNISRYGTTQEMVLIIKYPDIIKEDHVSADTYYKNKVGDTVTFNQYIGDNNMSFSAIVIAFFLLIFIIIFSVEYPPISRL